MRTVAIDCRDWSAFADRWELDNIAEFQLLISQGCSNAHYLDHDDPIVVDYQSMCFWDRQVNLQIMNVSMM